jgi:hypothetical protein
MKKRVYAKEESNNLKRESEESIKKRKILKAGSQEKEKVQV